jgi:hypothetical protein
MALRLPGASSAQNHRQHLAVIARKYFKLAWQALNGQLQQTIGQC